MSSTHHMRWHFDNKIPDRVMCHPFNGYAWKEFDRMYLDFAVEPQNVRLGLRADGFSPFSQSSSPYFCWPIIVTPYNFLV